MSDKNQIVCGLTDNEDECIQKIQSIECGQTGYGNAEHPFYTIENMLKERGRKVIRRYISRWSLGSSAECDRRSS